jgi:hypothetical protein
MKWLTHMINSYISFVGPDIYKNNPSGANIGAIVGGTLGDIVFAILLVLGVIYIIKQQQKRQRIHI